jgi:hypothetical protein
MTVQQALIMLACIAIVTASIVYIGAEAGWW